MVERTAVLTGWGRTSPTAAQVARPAGVTEISELVRAAGPRGVLARGLGRSYGDAAQNAGGLVLDLSRLDTIGTLTPSGECICDAGVDLDSLLRYSVPAGWFVPVTPGTRQVTLGGAVAADVHGKNHHRDGSIARHVSRLELVDGNGEARTVTPRDDLFWATVGGMGLTGVITSVTLHMTPVTSAWIAVDTLRTANLDETLDALRACDVRRRYSVAWIDCLSRGTELGRGVITAGDHLAADELTGTAADEPLRFAPRTRIVAPPWAPTRLLGRAPVAAFNEAYYRRAPRRALSVPTHLSTFFHPLDAVAGWNRLYGRSGFVQYQFVTPDAAPISSVLRRLQEAGAPGLLAVLKRFGAGNEAPLSFPVEGWTLTIDVPARTPGLGAVLDAVDQEIVAHGGRVYLAKDSRLAPDMFAAMYPGLDRWREVRAAADPRGVFTSDLARRLHL